MENIIEKRLKQIDEEFKNTLSDKENGRNPIRDGALNPEEYFKAPLKIMWLMKEPYDEKNGKSDGWSFECFRTNSYKDLLKGGSKGTWRPVAYISYAVINNLRCFEDMGGLELYPAIADSLNKIAWVNINKLPSKNRTYTVHKDILQAYAKSKTLLNEQIELLNTDIIICGNTFSVVKGFNSVHKGSVGEGHHRASYHTCEGKRIIIGAYHPARKNTKMYVNNILKAIIDARK